MNVCICTTMGESKRKINMKKKRSQQQREQHAKSAYCLQRSLHFPAIKCNECHRTTFQMCVVFWVTLRFVFMSKAHFLWLRFFIIRIFFCFGHVQHTHTHTLSIHLLDILWMKWHEREKRMRCSFIPGYDDGRSVVCPWKDTRFPPFTHTHTLFIVWGVLLMVHERQKLGNNTKANRRYKYWGCEHINRPQYGKEYTKNAHTKNHFQWKCNFMFKFVAFFFFCEINFGYWNVHEKIAQFPLEKKVQF